MQCLVLLIALFILLIHASPSSCTSRLGIGLESAAIFDVLTYGAVGDGKADDTQAFLKAWADACKAGEAQGIPTLKMPSGKTFFLKPADFRGPCKSKGITVQLEGTIIAPQNSGDWTRKDRWIVFSGIDGLILTGGGQIDGQGSVWWKACSVKDSSGCVNRPTALYFDKCNGLQLSKLRHLNSPRNHIGLNDCDGVKISDLQILAPADSPNTDGIDIASSCNIEIKDSVMQTGDDCIAINNGTSHINITGVACGPGHGISVGSLGKNGAYDTVEEVHVRNCTFTGTQNGARIKTWKGGSGYARKVSFEQIVLIGPQNPIIIDQNYDPHGVINAGSLQSAVEVSDVTFRDVRGTSATELAIAINCSGGTGCTNVVLEQVDIKSAVPGKMTYASCNNAHGEAKACNPVVPCVAH